MRIRSPSLHELHAYAATARLGSFSRAADELCVTQGAVSRAVARLEEHLGKRLLERRGRVTVTTAAGRAYLDAIAPALHALEAAAVEARGDASRIKLSVPPTLAQKWLIPRLPDFRARHPDVALSFVPYRRDDALDGGADAWIRIGGERVLPASVRCEYLVGREIVPICRPQDLKGRRALRSPEDLLSRPLLFHTNYPDNWRLWFAAMGVHEPALNLVADFDQVAMLVQGVIAGLGLAVVQRCLIEDELAAGRVAIPVDRPALTDRGYVLCVPAKARERRALRVFREWVMTMSS